MCCCCCSLSCKQQRALLANHCYCGAAEALPLAVSFHTSRGRRRFIIIPEEPFAMFRRARPRLHLVRARAPLTPHGRCDTFDTPLTAQQYTAHSTTQDTTHKTTQPSTTQRASPHQTEVELSIYLTTRHVPDKPDERHEAHEVLACCHVQGP